MASLIVCNAVNYCFYSFTHTHAHQTFKHGFSSHPLSLGYDSAQQLLAIGAEHGAVLLYPIKHPVNKCSLSISAGSFHLLGSYMLQLLEPSDSLSAHSCLSRVLISFVFTLQLNVNVVSTLVLTP